MPKPKTNRVVGILTAVVFSAAAFAPSFAVNADQDTISNTPAGSVVEPPSATSVPSQSTSGIPISLTDGLNRPQTLTVQAKTVGDALKEAGVILAHTDRVKPAPDTLLAPNMSIIVTRVHFELQNVDAPIAPGTVFHMSKDVPPGHIKAGHAGVPGVITKTFRVGYVNGSKTSRKLVAKTVTKPAQPKETLAGIRVREARALPSRGGTYHRTKSYDMIATGYSPYEGSSTGRCATGMHAGYGVVAVDPRVIPLGSRLYIQGYGYAVAGDTGGAIKGRRIDLGNTTHREAQAVGRRHVKVWVLSASR